MRGPMHCTGRGPAGNCLGTVGMSLHHKLCHVLGGSFDLPHAETHTVILPHAAAFNQRAAPAALQRVARALGTGHGQAQASLTWQSRSALQHLCGNRNGGGRPGQGRRNCHIGTLLESASDQPRGHSSAPRGRLPGSQAIKLGMHFSWTKSFLNSPRMSIARMAGASPRLGQRHDTPHSASSFIRS